MGMNEDIQELNKRITSLTKTQEEAKKLLAVEEHKLGELAAALVEEGHNVSKMSDEEIAALIASLTDKFQTTMETLQSKLSQAEKLYSKLDEINQIGRAHV